MAAERATERAITDAMMHRHQAASLTRRLAAAREQAAASERRAEEAAGRIAAEQADVDRLEDLTWAWIWANLRRTHADDLAREQVELAAARYTAKTEQSRADADRASVADLEHQLADLGDVEAEYAAALDRKEHWLAANGDPDASRLAGIASAEGRLAAEDREVVEALEVGDIAVRRLVEVAALLDSAANLATWDLFGGGLFVGLAKHQRLKQVHEHMVVLLDEALKAFDRELGDVRALVARSIPDRLTVAVDLWFDNLFTDIRVRNGIVHARDDVARTRVRVEDLMRELTERRGELEARRTALATEREAIPFR